MLQCYIHINGSLATLPPPHPVTTGVHVAEGEERDTIPVRELDFHSYFIAIQAEANVYRITFLMQKGEWRHWEDAYYWIILPFPHNFTCIGNKFWGFFFIASYIIQPPLWSCSKCEEGLLPHSYQTLWSRINTFCPSKMGEQFSPHFAALLKFSLKWKWERWFHEKAHCVMVHTIPFQLSYNCKCFLLAEWALWVLPITFKISAPAV